MPATLDTSKPFKGQSLVGQRFGRRIVISFAGWKHYPSGPRRQYWNCMCDCGTPCVVEHRVLLLNIAQSCGCLNREALLAALTKHGYALSSGEHPLYHLWCAIRGRCYRKTCPAYKDYGARGIYMCERWRTSAANFIADMLPTWKPGLTIERRDNDGPYSPENCYWATRIEQANNKRTSRHITFEGRTQTVAQWAREKGIRMKILWARLFKQKWSVEKALTAPITKPSDCWRGWKRLKATS